MSTAAERAAARGTGTIKRVLAVVTVILMSMMTAMLGAIAVAPAAQACPEGCQEQRVTIPGGSGEFCSAQGVTNTFRWDGASRMVTYGPAPACGFDTLAEATRAVQDIVDANKDAAVPAGYTEGACLFVCRSERASSPGGTGQYCDANGENVPVEWLGAAASQTYGPFLAASGTREVTCDFAPDEANAALAEAQRLADEQVRVNMEEAYGRHTPGACVIPERFGAPGSWTITTDICFNGGFETNTVTATTAVTGYDTPEAAFAAAEQAARVDAESQVAAFLAARPGYTLAPADHVCTIPTEPQAVTVAPVAPATVAQPAPAVVAPEEVSIPEAATVPEAVPAGDGTTAPQVPVLMLAVAGLATAGAVTAGRWLAGQR